MQKAAKKSFKYIVKNTKFKKILIVCGPGNNGGDGMLIAKYLKENKKDVTVYAPIKLSKTTDSKKAFKAINEYKLIKNKIKFNDYDLIIDCIFGVGFSRPISKKLYSIIQTINKSKKFVISVDMPSGVHIDTGSISNIAIKANVTLTFHRLKPGLLLMPGKECAGKIEILDIGLVNLDKETNIHLIEPPKLKKTKISNHKYNRGTTYIIAGDELVGAAKLATLAASKASLRSGSGISKIFVKADQESFFKTHILEEMIIKYKNVDHLQEIIKKIKINSLVFGCGIEVNKSSHNILSFLLKQNFPIVLDASVFSLISMKKKYYFELLRKRKTEVIFTPHQGEFDKVFTNKKDKITSCLKATKETNSILLLKGNDTIIVSTDKKIYLNFENSPHLATAGSGDVLAGLIGGFLSQKYSGIESTKLASYIHSECGKNLGYGLIASDLISTIPKIMKKL